MKFVGWNTLITRPVRYFRSSLPFRLDSKAVRSFFCISSGLRNGARRLPQLNSLITSRIFYLSSTLASATELFIHHNYLIPCFYCPIKYLQEFLVSIVSNPPPIVPSFTMQYTSVATFRAFHESILPRGFMKASGMPLFDVFSGFPSYASESGQLVTGKLPITIDFFC